jgi:hypothetical protein
MSGYKQQGTSKLIFTIRNNAGNWAGPGRSKPIVLRAKRVRTKKGQKNLDRAVRSQSVKTVVQPSPKLRRAFLGSCRLKPDPYI